MDTATYLRIKNITDKILAFVLISASIPLFIIIILFIFLKDGRPILFAQNRVGHDRKPFLMYKFRTLANDTEGLAGDYQQINEVEPPTFKIHKDPRVTRTGRFLRATYLDELPQLLNILVGDMHLIGFRPPLEPEVGKYEPWQLERFAGYPGITSTWAVSGMHDLGFKRWMELDIEYLKSADPWKDFKIIFKTVFLILDAVNRYFTK
ncbi:sugar transferase [Candidatus Altiarchaeota archaeon]